MMKLYSQLKQLAAFSQLFSQIGSIDGVLNTAQKIKFSIEVLFSKCDQNHKILRIPSHLLKKSLMKNCEIENEECCFQTYVCSTKFHCLNFLFPNVSNTYLLLIRTLVTESCIYWSKCTKISFLQENILTGNAIILVTLLLTVNIFHDLFQCFYC